MVLGYILVMEFEHGLGCVCLMFKSSKKKIIVCKGYGAKFVNTVLQAVGIWKCGDKNCRVQVAGGAYTYTTTAAASIRYTSVQTV